jgi:hypothetical protein
MRVDLPPPPGITAGMRICLLLLVCGAVLLPGCSKKHAAANSATTGAFTPDGKQKLIVTPETALVGKVSSVQTPGRFVVLSFPVGHLPALEQRLHVYRRGLRVGELRVTGPRMDDLVVADVLDGEAGMGDEVRDR